MAAKNRHPIVWIFNIVILLLSVASIVSYFYMPFWRFSVSYMLDQESLSEMLGDKVDIDEAAIVGDGIEVSIGLDIETMDLVTACIGTQETVFEEIVDRNVNNIVAGINDSLFDASKNMMNAVTSALAEDQLMIGVRRILPDASDAEIRAKLKAIGINEEYLHAQTKGLVDTIYNSGATDEEISDEIVKIVQNIYAKMASGKDADLQKATFTAEDETELRKRIDETLTNLVDDDGNVNSDVLLANLLMQAIGKSMSSGESANNNEDSANNEDAASTGVSLLADEPVDETTDGPTDEPANETGLSYGKDLNETITNLLLDIIPANLVVLVLRVLAAIFLFSSFMWAYTVVKIFVKLLAPYKNPTVKLKAPIWLGWLPYLIFAGIPTLVFKVFSSSLLAGRLGTVVPDQIMTFLGAFHFSFFSAGCVAAASALFCLIVSFFYMGTRRKIKKQLKKEKKEA